MNRRTSALLVVPAAILILGLPHRASAQRCAHEAQRTASVPTAGVDTIRILAFAGSLEVTGRAGPERVAARGRACASEAAYLAELTLSVRREGSALVLEAKAPDEDDDYYAYLDVVVELPQGIPVTIVDGSGDMTVTGVGGARVLDGSGDIHLSDVRATLDVTDGSGEIHIANVSGAIKVNDGSGTIEIRNARADIDVLDGSGDVRAQEIGGSVRVNDSSGEVRVADVVRNVVVADGSGSIRVERVGGDFTVEDDGSGDVSYTNVSGRVSVPDDD